MYIKTPFLKSQRGRYLPIMSGRLEGQLMVLIVTSALLALGCASASYRAVETIDMSSSEASPRLCTAQQKGERWAVVVGIDTYQDSKITPLNGATHDAWAFYHYLSSPHGGRVALDKRLILLNWQATRANLEKAFGQFLSRACPQDTIYIYFAGHGAPEPDRASEAFLLTYDTQLDNLVGTAISMRQLPRFLSWRAGQAGRLMMFVDACHSGALQFSGQRGIKMDEQRDESGFASKRSESVHGQLNDLSKSEPKWDLFAAASSTQVAVEAKGDLCPYSEWDYKGGLFTCALLKALSGDADQDRDGQVESRELFTFVTHDVDQKSQGAQRPQWSGRGVEAPQDPTAPEGTSTPKGSPLKGLDQSALPSISGQINIPKIPSYLLKRPTSGPSTLTWSALGSTVLTSGVATYFMSQADSSASNISNNALGVSSYEVDRQQRVEYQAQKDNAMIALSVTGGLALTSIGLWIYDYASQRSSREARWFTLKPSIGVPTPPSKSPPSLQVTPAPSLYEKIYPFRALSHD